MISLSPDGRMAALCTGGRLLLVSKGVHHETRAPEGSLALAFNEEVWLVEPTRRGTLLRRLSRHGELLGETALGALGDAPYARAMGTSTPSAVVGGTAAAFICRLEQDNLAGSEVRNAPARIVPTRELVMIHKGQARLRQVRTGRLLSPLDLRVRDGFSLQDGYSIALVGRDSRGTRIDVVSVKRGASHARLRTEPGVLICASSNTGRLVIVHDRMLTVFDVVARRDVVKKRLTSRPVAIAVDQNAELLAIETAAGDLDLFELPAMTIESGRLPETDEPPAAAEDEDSAQAEDDAPSEDAPEVDAEVAAWRAAFVATRGTSQATGALIGGSFRPTETPTGVVEHRCPFDPDDVIGAFPFAASDVDDAVSAACDALHAWRGTRVEGRGAAMRSFDDQLRRRRTALEIAMARDTGRPRWECAREVAGLSHRLGYTVATGAGTLATQTDNVAPGGTHSRPYGVVAIAGPAMFPLATSHLHIAGALISGNTVVWKPSPLCTATAQIYADALRASDIPAGVANVVFGGDDLGAMLTGHPGVDCVVFTGSTENGRKVHAQNAGVVEKKLILHLGAKNAAIVTKDCLIDLAAYEVATSAFISAGQRCTSLSRAYVQRSVFDEFVTQLIAICEGFQIGPPTGEHFSGPMLSRARRDRFVAQIESAPAGGARLLHRVEPACDKGYFVGPSIHLVENPTKDDPYQTAEHFGPDLAVYPVTGIDEAMDLCNDTDFGLCGALFTESHQEWLKFQREAAVGLAMLNTGTHSVSGRLPLQGVKSSGYGGSAGAAALPSLRRDLAFQERHSDLVDVWPGTRAPESGTNS